MQDYDEGYLDGYRAAQKEAEQEVVVRDGVRLDCVSHDVFAGGNKAHLSGSESMILGTLMRSRSVVTRERLTEALYPLPADEPEMTDNIIRVFVSHLRHKLDRLGVDRQFLINLHNVGYQVQDSWPQKAA